MPGVHGTDRSVPIGDVLLNYSSQPLESEDSQTSGAGRGEAEYHGPWLRLVDVLVDVAIAMSIIVLVVLSLVLLVNTIRIVSFESDSLSNPLPECRASLGRYHSSTFICVLGGA